MDEPNSLRFSWRRYRLPFRRPVRTAHGLWEERDGFWVRLERDDGRPGYGEIAPLPQFGSATADEIEKQLGSLGTAFRGGAWRERAELDGSVRAGLAAAEAAFQEVSAPVRDYWPVAALLPAGREVLRALPPLLETGFRTFKWKVGVGDAADEWGLLDDVLGQLPTGARLRLDANGAWERRQAERWLERCAERPIEFLEQPVSAQGRGAEDLLLGLASDYPTPIALDESLVTAGDLDRWLGHGWPGVWVVKLSVLGAADEVLAKLAKAQADVMFSSALETGLGAAATLQAAFHWTGNVRALGYGVWPLFQDGRFNGPARAPFIRAGDLRFDPTELWETLG